MARRRVKPSEGAAKRKPLLAMDWKFSRHSVRTAALVQIDADHPWWRDQGTPPGPGTIGGIVKIIPPPDTPESVVHELERLFYEQGAASVKVMPVPEQVKVTVEGVEFDFEAAPDGRTLRQVVMDRCDKVTNAHDPKALRSLCTQAMDHAEGT